MVLHSFNVENIVQFLIMVMDKNELHGLIVSKGYTITGLSEKLGWHRNTLPQKMRLGNLRINDLKKIAKILGYTLTIKMN